MKEVIYVCPYCGREYQDEHNICCDEFGHLIEEEIEDERLL